MRFTLQLGFARFPDFQRIAQVPEEAGFSSVGMPDSYFFPKHTDSVCPYTDTKVIRGYIEAMPFTEALVEMSWMAAVTRRIRGAGPTGGRSRDLIARPSTPPAPSYTSYPA